MKKNLSKGIISSFIVGAIALTTSPAFASDIGIIMDGQSLSTSTSPTIINGSTLVPMRGIFEALGATVSWDQDSQTVTGTKGNTKIVLHIGSTEGIVNGAQVPLNIPAQVINGSTMVPLRFVGESLGTKVEWDPANRNVVIKSVNSDAPTDLPVVQGNFTQDLKWLGMDDDKVGHHYNFKPNGEKDGHFQLSLTLPNQTKIKSIQLYNSYSDGSMSESSQSGYHDWSTDISGYWPLGVFFNGKQLNTEYSGTLEIFSGNVTLDLYANSDDAFLSGKHYTAEVLLDNGTKIKKTVEIE